MAQTKVTIGLIWPLGPVLRVSVTLRACASSGPTEKILTHVALLPGGGWVLKNVSHCWWDFKCCSFGGHKLPSWMILPKQNLSPPTSPTIF